MRTLVLQIKSKIRIKDLQAIRFLSRGLRWESAVKDQTGEQYFRQGRIEWLERYDLISSSPKILKEFSSNNLLNDEHEMETVFLQNKSAIKQ